MRTASIVRTIVIALLAILAFSVVLSGCGGEETPEDNGQEAAWIGKGHREPIPPVREIPEPEPEPELPTGLLVMIDNEETSRPQMGLDKADVVFEIIAEGGITRYLALFYRKEAPVIGPVRSARYYFVQLAKGMDLPFAHVGGAEDALTMIGNLRIKDINEMSNAQGYFWQDRNRRRPHATFTSTALLVEAAANKQFAFKDPVLPPVGDVFEGTALADGQVTLTYVQGRNGYQVQWIWDDTLGEGGQYRRYINGAAQSSGDGAPIVADTIMILTAPSRARNTAPPTSAVEIVGEGEAIGITENQIIRGSWNKESAERPLYILDEKKWPMERKQGNLWIQVVDNLEAVSFGKR